MDVAPNGASLCTDQVHAGTGAVAEAVKEREKKRLSCGFLNSWGQP